MTKKIPFNLGIYLKEYRKNNSLTQKQIATILEIGIATFKKIETQNHIPGKEILSKILKLKGIDKEARINIQELILKKKKAIVYKEENKTIKIDIKKILEVYVEMLLDKIETSSLIEKNRLNINTYSELKKINSLKNDYETVNRIAKLIFNFNENIHKTFGELELLLSTNKINENRKLKYGIENMAKNLKMMSEKLYSYIKDEEITSIIDIEEVKKND